MKSKYPELLKRLLAYRKAMGLTQEEMGLQLGVGQSHYCKIEAGNKILSFQGLECFEMKGGDIQYLFTEEKRVPGKMDEYLNQCQTDQGRLEFRKIMVWLLDQGVSLENLNSSNIFQSTWKSMKLAKEELEEPGIWKNIRKVEKLSQERMAAELDIGLKRYQRIERGEVNPDAEILYTLYCTFQYSPLVIMNHELYYLDEMNCIWEKLMDKTRERLEPFFEQALDLLKEREKIHFKKKESL